MPSDLFANAAAAVGPLTVFRAELIGQRTDELGVAVRGLHGGEGDNLFQQHRIPDAPGRSAGGCRDRVRQRSHPVARALGAAAGEPDRAGLRICRRAGRSEGIGGGAVPPARPQRPGAAGTGGRRHAAVPAAARAAQSRKALSAVGAGGASGGDRFGKSQPGGVRGTPARDLCRIRRRAGLGAVRRLLPTRLARQRAGGAGCAGQPNGRRHRCAHDAARAG